MMKKLLVIAFVLTATASFAQDPDLSGGIIQSTHSVAPDPFEIGEAVNFKINTSNAGGDMIMPTAPDVPYSITLITTNIGMPNITIVDGTNFYATPVITSLGNGQYKIVITQIADILELDYTVFRIGGITEKTFDEGGNTFYAGYSASIDAGAYAGTNVGLDNPASKGLIGTVLPVTLTSFKAAKEGELTLLNWTTTEESNSDRFEVERSQNGKSWSMIGTVKSNGESKVLKNYAYTDAKPLNGDNLYRLKMIDNDKTFAYSRVVNVKFEGQNNLASGQVSIYPNPTSEKVFLQDADLTAINAVAITDVNGRSVYASKSVSSNGINVSNLTAGLYILNVTNLDGTSNAHKLLIKR